MSLAVLLLGLYGNTHFQEQGNTAKSTAVLRALLSHHFFVGFFKIRRAARAAQAVVRLLDLLKAKVGKQAPMSKSTL